MTALMPPVGADVTSLMGGAAQSETQDDTPPPTLTSAPAPSIMERVAERSTPVLGEGLSNLLGAYGDVGVGAAKGAANTVTNIAKLTYRLPGIRALTRRIHGLSDEDIDRAFATADEALKPANTAQAIGRAGEQIAETVIPGRMVTGAGVALASRLPRGVQTAARMAVEGAGGASMATAQGGNASVAGGVSAGLTGAGALVGAVRPGAAAAMTEALDFARRRGIPVDAATATGSRVVRGVQDLVSRGTFAGRMVGGHAERAREGAMTRVAGDLAREAAPLPVAPEQAGTGLRQGVTNALTQHHNTANQQYGRLRAIEADPRNLTTVQTGTRRVETGVLRADGSPVVRIEPVTEDIPMAVDQLRAQTALRPVMERMHRQLPITVARSSPGLRAIENIVNGPRYASASTVDTDLGIIKSVSREADLPQLRDLSQGLAARAVRELEAAVQTAVNEAGEEAVEALAAGRAATRAKYAAADVLGAIRDEPVQAFNQAVYAKDAGIAQLREVARLAPQEMPRIGRAYLDDLFTKATEKGGFGREEGLFRAWQNLGPETKRILFPSTPLRRDLDAFFTLASKSAENINKSGSGFTAMLGAQGAWAFTDPTGATLAQIPAAAVARLLHSSAGVRLLTQGLRLPSLNPTTAANVLEQLRRAGERAAATSPAAGPSGPAPAHGAPGR